MDVDLKNMLIIYKGAGSLPFVRDSTVITEDRVYNTRSDVPINRMQIVFQQKEPSLPLVRDSEMCLGDRVYNTRTKVFGRFDDWGNSRTSFTVSFEGTHEKSRLRKVAGRELDEWVVMDLPENDPLIPGEIVRNTRTGQQGEFVSYTMDGNIRVLLNHEDIDGVVIDKEDALYWVSA